MDLVGGFTDKVTGMDLVLYRNADKERDPGERSDVSIQANLSGSGFAGTAHPDREIGWEIGGVEPVLDCRKIVCNREAKIAEIHRCEIWEKELRET
jgi:hypothetical protein